MKHYELTAVAFANSIDVPKSSISHIINGRNKPSLEFIMKINNTFPEVSLQWLLNAKGNFPATPSIKKENKLSQNKTFTMKKRDDRTIERIVVFYSDGTFKTYTE